MTDVVHLPGHLSCSAAEGTAVRRLRDLAQRQAGPDALVAALAAAGADLGAGLPGALHRGIERGLGGAGWDDAVAAFGDALGSELMFYLGPMLAREDDEPRTGLLLGHQDRAAEQLTAAIESVAAELGGSLFGFPCRFHGRKVEFYDLGLAAGPPVEFTEAPIALFTPFYFAGWSDAERQHDRRRTILFTNVVAERFDRIAARVLRSGALVNGAPPALITATEEQRRAAVVVWLTLHELMHGSGPVPFFATWAGKNRVDEYGVIEEARVDMSSFLAADLLAAAIPEAALARELIVMERLFRSARRGWARRTAGQPVELDDEHGRCWLSVAAGGGAVTVTGDTVDVDLDRLDVAVRAALGHVYQAEQRAATEENTEARLRVEAGPLRRVLLPDTAPSELDAVETFYRNRCADIPVTAQLSA